MQALIEFKRRSLPRRRASDVRVRPATTDDVHRINALYNDPQARPDAAAIGCPKRTKPQWMWEYGTPSPQPPAYMLAAQGDRVVGTQAYIPVELLIDGELVLSGKDEDTLVHPDHRGCGLLDEMYRHLFERAEADRVRMLWGFTATAARALLRNGFFSIGRFQAMRCGLGPGGSCRTDPIEKAGASADDSTRGAVTIREIERPDPQSDEFSLAFGRCFGGIMVHLSARYLQWRLFDNPFRRHRLLAAYDRNRLVGLAALKIDADCVGRIADLVALPTDGRAVENTLQALLARASSVLQECGCEVVEARPSGEHPFNRIVQGVLLSNGFEFLPAERATEFMVRPIGAMDDRLIDMAQWRICEIMREY